MRRWPTDYDAWNEGRLLLHPDFAVAFRARGWTTVAAVLADRTVEVVREVGTRDNCRIELPTERGLVRLFLKRHREPPGNRTWLPAGMAEAEAVGWCQAAEAPTMDIAAAGRTWLPDGRVGSFFLSVEAPGRPADAAWAAETDPNRRTDLLDALARTAGRMHGAGLFHRDFYWCHFFVEGSGHDAVARIIDVQRTLRRPWDSWRWLTKDLGQFWFSAPRDVAGWQQERWFDL